VSAVAGQAGSCYYNGPMPVDEALARIRALRAGEHRLLPEAWLSLEIGRLCAMKGDAERAHELWIGARQVYVDAGLLMSAASFAQGGAHLAFRAGDPRLEEARLREGLEVLEGIGERGFYATGALMLAECLYAQERMRQRSRRCARRLARRRSPMISSTSSGSTWSAGCFTHAAASTSRPRPLASSGRAGREDGPAHRAVVPPCVPRRGLGPVRSERRGSEGGGGGVRDLRGEG
jgi:hypothetical protein